MKAPDPYVPSLLVDAGSSRLKWAWWSGGVLHPGDARVHNESLADPVAAIPHRLVGRVVVASVLAAPMRSTLIKSLKERFGVEPEAAETTTSCCGVVNGYRDPRQLGVDRWLAMIAVCNQRSRDSVVVDCGTAVTIDVVDSEGRHLGGQIIPGFSAMTSSLMRTTRLESLGAQTPGLLGHSTAGCVAAGIGHAVASAIERVADAVAVDTSGGADVIMTGGDAMLVSPLVRRPTEVRPHLVLEGLAMWAGQELKG